MFGLLLTGFAAGCLPPGLALADAAPGWVWLLVGLAVLAAGAALLLVSAVVTGLRRLRQSLPGQLLQALRQDIASGDFARRLAQPKSLSGMDSVYGPQIQADFPELNLAELKIRAERLAVSTLAAIDAADLDLLSESDGLYRAQVRLYLDRLNDHGWRERYDGIAAHRTVIADYSRQSGTCRIGLQSAVGAYYRRELAGQAAERLLPDAPADAAGTLTQFRILTEALYVQDPDQAEWAELKSLAFNCPNCGAPVKSLGDRTCRFCGSAVEPLNSRVWSFSRFEHSPP